MAIKNVLVVDDSPTDRQHLTDILSKGGYAVTTAASAEEGIAKVKQTKPEAVFIFLAPPSKEELKRRLEKRGTESRKEIMKRYRIATRELVQLNDLKLCDYRIVNREIPVATEVLKAIIRAERLSVTSRHHGPTE